MATTGRTITPRLLIAWDSVNYEDETERLISARGESRLVAPGSAIMSPRGIVDRMTLTLHNATSDAWTGRRYSPLNADGPLYTVLVNGGAYHRRVTFDVSINGGSYVRIFTGVIKIPREGVPTPRGEATVEIDCRSVDEDLLQIKINTSQARFAANNADGVTEADVIRQWLTDGAVGLSSSQYSIDAGMFVIPWAWLDDESVIEECWQLAAACGGRVYADKTGRIVYENMAHWLLHSTSSETLTRAQYRDLSIRYDDADLFSEVTVEASPRAPEDEDILWEPDEELQVPAGGTLSVTARMKYPAYTVTGVAYDGVTQGGTNITGDVSCSRVDYAQRVELTFSNANATYAAHLYRLQIHGRPVVGAPLLEEKRTSAAGWWLGRRKRSRSLRSNVYIQTRAHAAAVCEFLRDTHETPAMHYSISGVQGIATRSLGDLITINDTEVMTEGGRTAYVTGISWTVDSNGYSQNLDAIDAAGVYKHTLSEYFVVGTDTMGSSKYCFY